MNWDAIGAIGELVGAGAVVATLVYLAIQTRLTRKAVEESSQYAYQQATHTAVGMYSDWRRALMGAPHIAAIIVKAQSGEELAPDEYLLYSVCFQDLFLAAASSYRGVIHHTAGYDESIGVMKWSTKFGHQVKALKCHSEVKNDNEKTSPTKTYRRIQA